MIRLRANHLSALVAVLGVLLAGPGRASTDEVGATPMARKDAPAPQAQDPPLPPGAGRVVLRCQVLSDRTVGGCQVAYEAPAGHGLGEAALHMTSEIRIPTATFKPELVGAMVDIPLRFSVDADTGDMPTGPNR